MVQKEHAAESTRELPEPVVPLFMCLGFRVLSTGKAGYLLMSTSGKYKAC